MRLREGVAVVAIQDRIEARYDRLVTDHRAVLEGQLVDDEHYRAHALVTSLASVTARAPGAPDTTSGDITSAVSAAAARIAEARHLGGDPASRARSLPRDPHLLALALAGPSVLVVDLGPTGHAEATLAARVPHEEVDSLVRTGVTRLDGEHARLAFTDHSFLDLCVHLVSGPDFWPMAARLGPERPACPSTRQEHPR